MIAERLPEECKIWLDSDGNQFRIPPFLTNPSELKIHDWYLMSGCVSAYAVSQITSLSDMVRSRLTQFFYAMEYLTYKQ